MRLLLLFAALLLPVAQATPAWALHDMDEINQTWTGSPMPNGGTYYSNGLDTVEVSPSGPSSSTYSAWTRDGKQSTGTIYLQPRYDAPRESLSDWWGRQPSRPSAVPSPCGDCSYPRR